MGCQRLSAIHSSAGSHTFDGVQIWGTNIDALSYLNSTQVKSTITLGVTDVFSRIKNWFTLSAHSNEGSRYKPNRETLAHWENNVTFTGDIKMKCHSVTGRVLDLTIFSHLNSGDFQQNEYLNEIIFFWFDIIITANKNSKMRIFSSA